LSGRSGGTRELDVVDFFASIPLAFIHMVIEANMASEIIFGYETLPVGIDFLA
jgi:hypothetical protein